MNDNGEDSRMLVTALIPAHNEAATITDVIRGLQAQTRPPDRIIVIADNCTDQTPELARTAGAEVFVTVDNRDKKAGGLNQALDLLLPTLSADDVILVQDADSFLDPTFVEKGLAAYTEGVGGVGGVFRGRLDGPTRWSRVVQWFQTNEYSRYELDIRRQRGRVLVLTGTATLLRVSILREVIEARRSGVLPGAPQVYDTKVLTEDNELSFGLMHLGYKIKSPSGCTLTTETMPSLRTLAQQRLRWKRGAIENLFDYGWSRVTAAYWGRQALAVAGLLITAAYLTTLVWGVFLGLQLQLVWVLVTLGFSLERVITVRRRGRLAMAIAALIVVEFVYDVFLQGVQAVAYANAVTGKERRW